MICYIIIPIQTTLNAENKELVSALKEQLIVKDKTISELITIKIN